MPSGQSSDNMKIKWAFVSTFIESQKGEFTGCLCILFSLQCKINRYQKGVVSTK